MTCTNHCRLTQTDFKLDSDCLHTLEWLQSVWVTLWLFGDSLPPTRWPVQSPFDWNWLSRGFFFYLAQSTLRKRNFVHLLKGWRESKVQFNMLIITPENKRTSLKTSFSFQNKTCWNISIYSCIIMDARATLRLYPFPFLPGQITSL